MQRNLIPPIIALAFVGFCFWFLDAMSYTNQHPFTTITLDRDRAWWIEYMVEEKKKGNQELRAIEYVHNRRGRFMDITHRTPVIKRPKKLKTEPFYVDPSSIPQILRHPVKRPRGQLHLLTR